MIQYSLADVVRDKGPGVLIHCESVPDIPSELLKAAALYSHMGMIISSTILLRIATPKLNWKA